VIDSHPYENVDGDGRPLCHDDDEIAPDYETVFVQQTEENASAAKNASEIDVILSQRMIQNKIASDNSASTSPAQPPPPKTGVEADSRKSSDEDSVDRCRR
jgi:hypothetical protein